VIAIIGYWGYPSKIEWYTLPVCIGHSVLFWVGLTLLKLQPPNANSAAQKNDFGDTEGVIKQFLVTEEV